MLAKGYRGMNTNDCKGGLESAILHNLSQSDSVRPSLIAKRVITRGNGIPKTQDGGSHYYGGEDIQKRRY